MQANEGNCLLGNCVSSIGYYLVQIAAVFEDVPNVGPVASPCLVPNRHLSPWMEERLPKRLARVAPEGQMIIARPFNSLANDFKIWVVHPGAASKGERRASDSVGCVRVHRGEGHKVDCVFSASPRMTTLKPVETQVPQQWLDSCRERLPHNSTVHAHVTILAALAEAFTQPRQTST